MCVVGRHKSLAVASKTGRSNGPGIADQCDEPTSAPKGDAPNTSSDVSQDGSAVGQQAQSKGGRRRLSLALEQLATRATGEGLDTAAALLRAVAEQLRLP